MNAIDDGLISGNYDLADFLFLLGGIVAVLAAVLYAGVNPPTSRWAPVALAAAVALALFGWLVL